MTTKLEVDRFQKEIKVDCECGNVFYVSGHIPMRTVCDYCKREIGLRLALKLLNS